jgi:cell division protein FtsZ
MKLTDAFKMADDVLATAAKGIAEIITVTGYVNVDFEDVKTVMRDSGKAIMGTGRAKGENRAEEAIKLAINSPLLNDSNIEGAKNILIYITSGSDEVSLDEVVEITEYAQSICGNSSDVIWGNGVDESLGEDISVTLIATGFDSKRTTHTIPAATAQPANPLPVCQPATPCESTNRTVHTLDEQEKQPETTTTPIIDFNANETSNDIEDDVPHAVVHSLNEKTEARSAETSVFKHEQVESTPSVKVFDNPFANNNNDDESFEFSNSFETHHTQAETVEVETLVLGEQQEKTYDPKEELKRTRLRAMSLNFKTQKGLEELEREPAYMRRNKNYEEIEFEEEVSEYSATSQGISAENSFLHKGVD